MYISKILKYIKHLFCSYFTQYIFQNLYYTEVAKTIMLIRKKLILKLYFQYLCEKYG